MSPTPPTPATPVSLDDPLIVLPWPDARVDPIGHDPRSVYVEQFWLGIIGPSTTFLLRRIAAGFDAYPNGFELDLTETAAAIGLAPNSTKHGPFGRTIHRAIAFGLARQDGYGLEVRRRMPSLSNRQILRLPPTMRAAHQSWLDVDNEGVRAERDRHRARHLAVAMLDLGDEPELVERQLHAIGFGRACADEAIKWARGGTGTRAA
jgi:hypothetical protein